MQKVAVLGLGYVGLTMAACMADHGVRTIGVDVDENKLLSIQAGTFAVHEKSLKSLVLKGLKTKTLILTQDIEDAVRKSQMTFITVGTPSRPDGSMSTSQLEAAFTYVGRALTKKTDYHLVIVRSTVLPSTSVRMTKYVTELSGKSCGDEFGLCANPEFLSEGTAVRDMQKPDRIIIGEYDKKSGDMLEEFYSRLYLGNLPTIIRTSLSNAELIKYVNNAFLASKVSFVNSIANLCEKIPDTDVKVVTRAIGLDQRIGSSFLNAGLGWGGSCFPKDVKAILTFARDLSIDLPIVNAALQINDRQPILAAEIADEALNGVEGKRIAILGLAFKPNTDDIREAVSLKLIDEFRRRKADICAYDPAANENAARILGNSVTFAKSARECIRGADCCIIVTEWDEFGELQPRDFVANMRKPLLIDGRRLYDPDEFSTSVEYYAVGLARNRNG